MSESQLKQAVYLQQKNKLDDATQLYSQILKKTPDNFSALVNNAVNLRKQGKFSAAKTYYRRAIEIKPDDATLWSNYGNVLCDMWLFHEAEEAFKKAISLSGESAENFYNAGNVPFYNNRPEEAIELYTKALTLNPQHHNAKWNRSLSYLQQGDFINGLSGYESRFEKLDSVNLSKNMKRWQGEDLTDKKILLTREQGLGDMMQFVRFARNLKQKGAEVYLEASAPLKRFMFSVYGVDHVVDEGYRNASLDYYFPVMSLPHVLKITIDDLPATHHYLDVDKFIIPGKLPGNSVKKVGLVWASKPGHASDRSCSLEMLMPLFENRNVDFYSFQKGDVTKEINTLGIDGLIYDLDSYMPDFYDTAAYMKEMDLIISIDSSPLHCSAALGIKTWGLVLHAAEWRWLMNRDDSPWYPSLKLFRQKIHNQWQGVLEDLFKEFKIFLSENEY